MNRTVSQWIAEFLSEKGITHAFGIIGAGNVTLFDAIAAHGKTKIVPCHHEQAAAQAATAYFRVSRRLAVVLCTTGAGSSNAVTGVLAGFMDSVPLLVLSGNEPAPYFDVPHPRVIGVQGYDSSSVARGFTKHAWRVDDASLAQHIFHQAHELALAHRQGPVWIDVPRDLQSATVPPLPEHKLPEHKELCR